MNGNRTVCNRCYNLTKVFRSHIANGKNSTKIRFSGLVGNNVSAAVKLKLSFKNSGSGVRAIGTSSGMSAQKLDYRSALSQISASTAQIKLYASQSLATSGSQLATAVVGYAANSADTTKPYDVDTVVTMIANLNKANEEIVKMIKAYFKAILAIAKADETDETAYRNLQTALSGLSVDALFESSNPYLSNIPAESQIHALYAKYQSINTAITKAEAEVAYYNNVDGRSLNAVPGATPLSGSPLAGS
jgi:hypothetical protein